MKASDAVAKVLSQNNVTVGFELIGGMITHLVDSINSLGETKLISVHHEQAAAFAAGGVARATNNKQIGLALGTSGPGATNLITGIADCWLDNYPCIFITGQVNTNELKGERNIRQQGFQELDIVSIVKSITKYAVQIKHKEDLIPELMAAITLAKEGRPGPVLIDIPMDIQRADININLDSCIYNVVSSPSYDNDHSEFNQVIDALMNAKKPLFLIGGGAISEELFSSWQKLISRQGIPHVASLKGSERTQGIDGYFGMIGSYGTRTANYALQQADVIIVLGSRLDVRQTGADTLDFARKAKTIVQIDIDSEQLNNRIKCHINLNVSCGKFFDNYLNCHKERFSNKYSYWLSELNQHWDDMFVDEYSDFTISPFTLSLTLSKEFNQHAVQFVADVGNHQMWVAHSLLLSSNQVIHHSGGLGAMGFSIPTSIGIQIASNQMVVAITGDGGAQLNIQELDIIAREKLPILIIVMNNKSLGMVRAFQELYFDGRNDSTYWQGYSSSFSNIGRAYNINSYEIYNEEDFRNCVNLFINKKEAMLLEIMMADVKECRPRLSFGNSIDKQSPFK